MDRMKGLQMTMNIEFFGAGTGLGLWSLLRMSRLSFGRAWNGIWLEYLQKDESTLGFSKGRR